MPLPKEFEDEPDAEPVPDTGGAGESKGGDGDTSPDTDTAGVGATALEKELSELVGSALGEHVPELKDKGEKVAESLGGVIKSAAKGLDKKLVQEATQHAADLAEARDKEMRALEDKVGKEADEAEVQANAAAEVLEKLADDVKDTDAKEAEAEKAVSDGATGANRAAAEEATLAGEEVAARDRAREQLTIAVSAENAAAGAAATAAAAKAYAMRMEAVKADAALLERIRSTDKAAALADHKRLAGEAAAAMTAFNEKCRDVSKQAAQVNKAHGKLGAANLKLAKLSKEATELETDLTAKIAAKEKLDKEAELADREELAYHTAAVAAATEENAAAQPSFDITMEDVSDVVGIDGVMEGKPPSVSKLGLVGKLFSKLENVGGDAKAAAAKDRRIKLEAKGAEAKSRAAAARRRSSQLDTLITSLEARYKKKKEAADNQSGVARAAEDALAEQHRSLTDLAGQRGELAEALAASLSAAEEARANLEIAGDAAFDAAAAATRATAAATEAEASTTRMSGVAAKAAAELTEERTKVAEANDKRAQAATRRSDALVRLRGAVSALTTLRAGLQVRRQEHSDKAVAAAQARIQAESKHLEARYIKDNQNTVLARILAGARKLGELREAATKAATDGADKPAEAEAKATDTYDDAIDA